MKEAKIQWAGNQVIVYDENDNFLFAKNLNNRLVINRVKARAKKLGYSCPQIYPGKDGIERIWL